MKQVTFTVARTGTPDAVGDIILPGSLKTYPNLLLTKEFDHDQIIGKVDQVCEVGNEIKVTADIPADCMHLYPAIGFRIIKAESNEHGGKTIHELALSGIGLSEAPNVDSEIKPINKQ